MEKVFICSPYRGDVNKNLANAIRYCRKADDHCKVPIAPHVYFTRLFPVENWMSRTTGMIWGKDLMQYCTEIWIFCDELTEGMIEEIAEAKWLGLEMRFFNTKMEELNRDNYLIHREIGAAYRRVITDYFGDCKPFTSGCRDCASCRRYKEKQSRERKGRNTGRIH